VKIASFPIGSVKHLSINLWYNTFVTCVVGSVLLRRRGMAKLKSRKAKAKAKVKPEKEKGGKKATIIDLVRSLFTENPEAATTDVITAVKKVFPKSKINKQHVGWYRKKFRDEGLPIPSRRKTAASKTTPKGKSKGKTRKLKRSKAKA